MLEKLNELKQQYMLDLLECTEGIHDAQERGNIASTKYWLGKKVVLKDVIIALDALIYEYSHETENKSL